MNSPWKNTLCASLPDDETIGLARKLGIKGSTMWNLLSGAYLRLGMRTRAAAIARANQLGILANIIEPPMTVGNRRTSQPVKRKQRYPKRKET